VKFLVVIRIYLMLGCVVARRLSDKVTAEEKLPIYYPQNSTNLGFTYCW
jgi:hypothetical protein